MKDPLHELILLFAKQYKHSRTHSLTMAIKAKTQTTFRRISDMKLSAPATVFFSYGNSVLDYLIFMQGNYICINILHMQ